MLICVVTILNKNKKGVPQRNKAQSKVVFGLPKRKKGSAIMNHAKGFQSPRGGTMALLVVVLSVVAFGYTVPNVSASSLSKAQEHNNHGQHHHSAAGCEAIHRILNGTNTATAATNHHDDKTEGFLVDHDQWHNHKDCKFNRDIKLYRMSLLEKSPCHSQWESQWGATLWGISN